MTATLEAAVAAVKSLITAHGMPIVFPNGSAMAAIKAQLAASEAVMALPKLEAPSHPYYADMDGGQTGVVIVGHLGDEDLAGLPLHIAAEILDDLTTNAAGVPFYGEIERGKKREMLLHAYGSELAAIVCKGIDEALQDRSEGHKRYRNHDGTRFAAISDETSIDEPFYEDCEPDAEYASPTTTFDFYGASEEARELIEQRDKAAALARRGILEGYAEGEPPTCEGCSKHVLRGQFVHVYDDVGAVHVDCLHPNATTDPTATCPEAGPIYVMLGDPLLYYHAVPPGGAKPNPTSAE